MDAWIGMDPCQLCGTTKVGTRFEVNDTYIELCNACVLLMFTDPFCDLCKCRTGVIVKDGVTMCDLCHTLEWLESPEADRMFRRNR